MVCKVRRAALIRLVGNQLYEDGDRSRSRAYQVSSLRIPLAMCRSLEDGVIIGAAICVDEAPLGQSYLY